MKFIHKFQCSVRIVFANLPINIKYQVISLSEFTINFLDLAFSAYCYTINVFILDIVMNAQIIAYLFLINRYNEYTFVIR